MGKTGEFLFDARSNDIQQCLENLTEDIESCCGYKIFARGIDYYHEGMVEDTHLNKHSNSISALVHGTRQYNVEIYIDDGEVYGYCSCPYDDVCKHMVAVLLHIDNEGFENIQEKRTIEIPAADLLDSFQTHLSQLTKEELINLVMKFAPENYILQIHNTKTDVKGANRIFSQAEKKILKFLNDEELLWDPSGMDSALMSQLDKLRGLENQIPELIGNLLLKIMTEINDAFDEGYLYVDHYYEEDYFESEDFNHYVISFIQQLPFSEKLNYLNMLDDTLEMMSYSTFEGIPKMYGDCFADEEPEKLARYIVENMPDLNDSFISEFFDTIDDKLSQKDKEKILIKLSDYKQEHLISLAELLMGQNRHKDAFGYIEKFLSEDKGFVSDKIIELYLELGHKTGTNLLAVADTAMDHNPTEKTISKIKETGLSDTKIYEDILREKRPDELLGFLESEKRLDEALELLTNARSFSDATIFSFFKRNKETFKTEAERYFLKRIDANLLNTGESYYARIAETIGQIKQINNTLAKEIVEDIRTNYKRRRNLITMLERF